MVDLILTSTYTDDIVTLAFDHQAGTLNVVSSITVGYHPSWITFYPGDHSLVFAVLEQADGRVVVLKYDREGKGSVVAQASSEGAGPCSLIATKTQLYVANYSGPTVARIPISSDAPYILTSPPSVIHLDGRGPNPARQESPHPHQVVIHDQYNELLVPDLGTDMVRRYRISEEGSLYNQEPHIQYEAGGGPRHIAFHDGNLYTLLELNSVVVRHRFPPSPDALTLVASTPSMSNPPPQPTDMLAAEILIPPPNPTYPTPYLYLSNRNDPSPLGDIISIFDLSNPDALELVAEVRSGLKHLRGMAFGGPDDKWLVAGGVNGGGVKVFERVDGGRELRVVAEHKDVEAPTGFLWL